MADNFGLKIGVEGERDFKNALRDINQSFKVLGSEMNLVSSQFEKNDKSVQAVTARNQVLGKEIDAQKDKISTLQQALQNATDSFGENDKRTQAWVVQLNNAEAGLNDMERELEQNNKALDDSAEGFEDAEKQVDEFGDELGNTGKVADDAGGKFEKLGTVVAGIGAAVGAAMVAVGAASVAAGKALYDMATGAAAAADNVDKQSQRLGMSRESFQEWDYILSQNGVSMDSMNTAMKSMTSAMADLDKGGQKGQETLAKLGVTTQDLKNLNQEEIFEKAVVALQKMPEGYEKATLSQQLFGKQGQEMLPMLNQSKGSIEELKEKTHEFGLVMSDDAVAAGVKFTDSMDTLTRTFGGVKNAIGAELLPGLTMITDAFAGLITGQADAGDQLKAGVDELVRNVSEMIPKVLDIVVHIVDTIAKVAPDIIKALVGGIVDNLPQIIKTAMTLLNTLLDALLAALPLLAEGAVQIAVALVDGLIANLPAIVEGALLVIIALAEGISDALPTLIPAIVDAILLIVDVLIKNMDQILGAAFKIIEGLAKGLIDALPKLIEALPKLITGIINFITNNLPQMIEMGIKLTVQLAAGLIKAIPQLVAVVPQIIAALVKGYAQHLSSMLTVGKDLVRGLWNGILAMRSWLYDKVKEFAKGILDGIKKALGIRSPSRAFAEVGTNMALGLGLGFEREMKNVSEEIQDAVPTTFEVEPQVDMASAGFPDVASMFSGEAFKAGAEQLSAAVSELSSALSVAADTMRSVTSAITTIDNSRVATLTVNGGGAISAEHLEQMMRRILFRL